MAKQTYRIYGTSKWMGMSGNAIMAFSNKLGSGKKISIQSVEIYNNTKYGALSTVDTVNPSPVRFKVAKVSALAGGNLLTPAKMDSDSVDVSASLTVTTEAAFTPTLVTIRGPYTDATVAVNDTAFTTGATTIAGEFRETTCYFVGSAGNTGTRLIINNTATDLTVDPPFTVAASTTGTIQEVETIATGAILKQLLPTNSMFPVGRGDAWPGTSNKSSTGSIFSCGANSNLQCIYVEQGENLAVFCDTPTSNYPVQVTVTLMVEGTPNSTYQYNYYTYINSTVHTLFSIANAASSGVVARIMNIEVVELGGLDTPYFQMVPIGAINDASFTDSSRKVNVVKMDSQYVDLSASVCEVFTNVPLIPYNVPSYYVAEGSAAAAIPRGFNYLNTKDFVGPTYMTFFPEAAGYKFPFTTYSSTFAPGTLGTQISMPMSTFKASGSTPLIVREGEGFAIVSGAETATGTSVSISAWQQFDFGITIAVESTFIPTLTITTQLVDGTPVSGAQVLVTTNTGATLPYQASVTISNSGTTATVTHNSHGLSTGDKVLIKGASLTENLGVFTIIKTGTNTYTYTMGSSPGSSPTGTIVSTYVFIYGTTDGSGLISVTQELPASQPIKGWARKATTAPYYKTGPISGTMSNSADSAVSALMIPDE